MPRHLRILRLFWTTSVAAEMEYRLNFALAVLGSAGNLAGSVFFLWLLYRSGYQPGGWPASHALIVVGLLTALEGFAATVLSPNLSRIVRHVETGTLDFVLLKPLDSQFWLSTRQISLLGLPDVILGLAAVAWGGWRAGLPISAAAAGLVPVLLAAAILYSLWFLLSATTIWFVKVYNITEVLRTLMGAGKIPLQAFPPGQRFFFTFVVPVAFLSTVPAQAILGQADATWLWGMAGLAAGLLALSRWFWRFALRFYTSASS